MRLIRIDRPTDAALNLATEDYLLNVVLTEPVLLMYRSNKAVVIGRNQNIWQEANLTYCSENGIELARRISGGGSVYHDPGNINVALIQAHHLAEVNRYENLLLPIIDLLQKHGLDARLNERNDIILDNRKLSGSAQFTNRRILIKHCTLLVNSDLGNLSAALRHPYEQIESKARPSVRSKVMNIAERLPDLHETDYWMDQIARSFKAVERSLTEEEERSIWALSRSRFTTDDWLYRRSPSFQLRHPFQIEGIRYPTELYVENGRIKHIQMKHPRLAEIKNALLGLDFREGQLIDSFKQLGLSLILH